MTANVKTRYTKDGSRQLKQGGKTSRKKVRKTPRERLKITKEEYNLKGKEAARILNEQLKIKEQKELEATRNKIKNAKDPLFDRESFMKEYHLTMVDMENKYWPNLDGWTGESPLHIFLTEEMEQCKGTIDKKIPAFDQPAASETQCWKGKSELMKKYDEYSQEVFDRKMNLKSDRFEQDQEQKFKRYGTETDREA